MSVWSFLVEGAEAAYDFVEPAISKVDDLLGATWKSPTAMGAIASTAGGIANYLTADADRDAQTEAYNYKTDVAAAQLARHNEGIKQAAKYYNSKRGLLKGAHSG